VYKDVTQTEYAFVTRELQIIALPIISLTRTRCYNTLMLVVAFIEWWYGPGWRDTAGRLERRLRATYQTFSIPILLTTLFAPWRRIVTPPGGSLEDRVRALGDNAVSRVVGFMMRLLTLLAGSLLLLGYAALGGIVLILWPLLPILGPVLIVGGLL
jgi:hypothetical protein